MYLSSVLASLDPEGAEVLVLDCFWICGNDVSIVTKAIWSSPLLAGASFRVRDWRGIFTLEKGVAAVVGVGDESQAIRFVQGETNPDFFDLRWERVCLGDCGVAQDILHTDFFNLFA